MSAVAAANSTVTLEELVGLFVGDNETRPCPHLNLVVAICERTRPQSPEEIFDLLYPAREDALDELPDRIVRWGHDLWLQRVYNRDPREWRKLVSSRTE